jgi:hypothetical protein
MNHESKNFQIQKIVDVFKIRPVVHLIDYPLEVPKKLSKLLTRHKLQIIDVDNTNIGFIILDKNLDSEKPFISRKRVAIIEEIELQEPYIGKGYGKAAYLELLKILGDLPLQSWNINDDSKTIWLSLVRDGLAQEDFIEIKGKKKMIGYVSIPAAVIAKLIDTNIQNIE